MGPFYCPADRKVYIDLASTRARRAFQAPGDFAQAYVIAHEVGHHVQNLLGTSDGCTTCAAQPEADANALSVRLELQADCYAGVWAHHGTSRNISSQATWRKRWAPPPPWATNIQGSAQGTWCRILHPRLGRSTQALVRYRVAVRFGRGLQHFRLLIASGAPLQGPGGWLQPALQRWLIGDVLVPNTPHNGLIVDDCRAYLRRNRGTGAATQKKLT